MSKPPKRAAAKFAGKGGARKNAEPGPGPASGSGAGIGAPFPRAASPAGRETQDDAIAPQPARKKPGTVKTAAKKAGAKKTGPDKTAGAKKNLGLKKNAGPKKSAAAKKGGASKTVRRAVRSGSAVLRTATLDGATAGVLDRLFEVVTLRRDADPNISHSARLLSRGTAKVAQKFGEEAVECLIEAVAGNSAKLIGESADVLYHLIVMWVDAGVQPGEIWAELQRREGTSGIAEKAARGTATRPAGE